MNTKYLIQTSSDAGRSWTTFGGYAQRKAAFRNYVNLTEEGKRTRMLIHGKVSITTHIEDAMASIGI